MSIISNLLSWGKSAQMCSPVSQTFLFVVIFCALSIAVAGVYVWMRFIRKQPGKASAPKVLVEDVSVVDGRVSIV